MKAKGTFSVSTIYNHVELHHKEKWHRKKQKPLIEDLHDGIDSPKFKLAKWPFPLGSGCHQQYGNKEFQNSVLEMILGNNGAFRAVSTTSFWNQYKTIFENYHKFGRELLSNDILNRFLRLSNFL